MKLKCVNCSTEFEKPQEQKTCSRKCSDEFKKKNNREQRECVFCKNKFEVKKNANIILCSDQCRKSWALIPENKEKRLLSGRLAMKEKHGHESAFALDSFLHKSKKTKKEKYGNENFVNVDKAKETKKERFGDENYNNVVKNKLTKKENFGDENYNNREKATRTMQELYGADHAIQKKEFQNKQQETNFKKYGVKSPLQNEKIFRNSRKTAFGVKQYKNTEHYYQGSYEKYFLETIEEKGFLNEVQQGLSFEYEHKGETHVYHTDFTFRGKQIEIKSGWTYNKNGADKELQGLNESKWKVVKDLVVLIGKSEISGFIKAL
jgi:hypothetical protein